MSTQRRIVTTTQLKNEAHATLDDFKDHVDPRYIGPGIWHSLHLAAKNAVSKTKQQHFVTMMKETCRSFPCPVCKGHCTEYITNHPLEEYFDVQVEVNGSKLSLGLFLWLWRFHNAVNLRLNKPIMSWDTAYNLYSSDDNLLRDKGCSVPSDEFENRSSSGRDALSHANSLTSETENHSHKTIYTPRGRAY